MLTDLNQLNEGRPWPIDAETGERHKQLVNHKKIFNGEPSDLIDSYFERIKVVRGDFLNHISFETKVNYQKKISVKTADLLLGETPTVKIKGDDQNDELNSLLEDIGFWEVMYEGTLDISRFGDTIVKVYQDDMGNPQICIIPATLWYPLVDPNNIKQVKGHVLAYTYTENRVEYIKFEIHYKGLYETRLHELRLNKIGKLLEQDEVYTGLTDFAVISMSNVTSSDSPYGISDYPDVNNIISEIEVRLTQMSKILDKHADPSMQIPSCCVEIDEETGRASVGTGDAFIIDSKESVEPKYITWDGQLEANFKHIEVLFNQLAILSELGTLFIGNGLEKLGTISGVALKKLAFNALAKINRLQMKMRRPMIQIIKLLSQIPSSGLKDLTNERVTIQFGESLPLSWEDLIDQVVVAVNGNVMSIETAIGLLNDNASAEEIQEEINRINIQKGVVDDGSNSELEHKQVPGDSE